MTRSDLLAAALGLAGLTLGAVAVVGGPATVPTVEPSRRLEPVRSAQLDCPAAASSGAGTRSLAALSAPVPVPNPGDADGADTAGSLRLFSGTRADGPPSMLSKRGRVVDVTAGASARAVGRSWRRASWHRVPRAGGSTGRGRASTVVWRSRTAPHRPHPGGSSGRRAGWGTSDDRRPIPSPDRLPSTSTFSDRVARCRWPVGGVCRWRRDRPASVQLSSLAVQEPELAVHVQATQGEVVAVVHDRSAEGVTPTGNEWLGPVTPPGAVVVVPGLPMCGAAAPASAQPRSSCAQTTRTLVVANPGALTALVRVRCSGRAAPSSPAAWRHCGSHRRRWSART